MLIKDKLIKTRERIPRAVDVMGEMGHDYNAQRISLGLMRTF